MFEELISIFAKHGFEVASRHITAGRPVFVNSEKNILLRPSEHGVCYHVAPYDIHLPIIDCNVSYLYPADPTKEFAINFMEYGRVGLSLVTGKYMTAIFEKCKGVDGDGNEIESYWGKYVQRDTLVEINLVLDEQRMLLEPHVKRFLTDPKYRDIQPRDLMAFFPDNDWAAQVRRRTIESVKEMNHLHRLSMTANLFDTVIFLDIDGVFFDLTYCLAGTYNDNALNMLRKFCERTNAQIVISSTWRKGAKSASIRPLLLAYGLDKYMVQGDDWRTLPNHDDPRGELIDEWLRRHPTVKHYLIIDDDSDFYEHHRNNLILVDGQNGLVGRDVLKMYDAISIMHGFDYLSIKDVAAEPVPLTDVSLQLNIGPRDRS